VSSLHNLSAHLDNQYFAGRLPLSLRKPILTPHQKRSARPELRRARRNAALPGPITVSQATILRHTT
jgi:hypothetical protein